MRLLTISLTAVLASALAAGTLMTLGWADLRFASPGAVIRAAVAGYSPREIPLAKSFN